MATTSSGVQHPATACFQLKLFCELRCSFWLGRLVTSSRYECVYGGCQNIHHASHTCSREGLIRFSSSSAASPAGAGAAKAIESRRAIFRMDIAASVCNDSMIFSKSFKKRIHSFGVCIAQVLPSSGGDLGTGVQHPG